MSNRKALCVGINLYRNYPSATLHGCVNDASAMKGMLSDETLGLGFDPNTDITVLVDAQATKANIMHQLSDMVAGAKAGKYGYLVFSMSSHGTQTPDLNGDEPDHYDEAFCPNDLAQKGSSWDRNHVIIDDELAALFRQLPSSVLLEVYLDTCHSGTGLRAIDLLAGRQPRYLPPPTVDGYLEVEHRQPHRRLHDAMLEKGLPHQILWAACRDDQTSADAQIGGSWHGAFTYYFEKELRTCKNQRSRAAVLVMIRADLAAQYYLQVPQLECPARPISGSHLRLSAPSRS
jgi:metacaspase-1